jgi:DNA repair exonuclease SbcCD nuclease subunit
MLRLLWRTDVHYSDQTPSSRTDDWTETVSRKLTEVGRIAREHDCCAVLDGGDFFNEKTPIRTSHRLVGRVARIHAHYPCPVFCNVGNHDVRLAKIDNLGQSPLGSLFDADVFRRLYDEHEMLVEHEGVKVRAVGIPYHGPRYDLDRFRAVRRRDEDWLLCTAHVLASPHGGEMFKGEDIVRYSDLPDLAPDVDVWLMSHWHRDQGIAEITKGKWVVNVGSLTRGALTQDNVEREPGVVVVGLWPRSEGVPPQLEFVKIPVSPASEVFDMEKRTREEARMMTVDAFVESVKKELQSSSDRPFREIVAAMNLPDKVRERAMEYIEGAARTR